MNPMWTYVAPEESRRKEQTEEQSHAPSPDKNLTSSQSTREGNNAQQSYTENGLPQADIVQQHQPCDNFELGAWDSGSAQKRCDWCKAKILTRKSVLGTEN